MRPLAVVLLVAAAAFALTLPYPLLWDDPVLVDRVAQAARERGIAGVAAAEFRLESADAARLGYYRPVVLLSLHLDALLSRPSFSTYHLTNALLHAANAGLVFLLLSGLLPSAGGAVFGALLFAVHPAHVESVAFVSGRTDLWATLFVLAAAVAWVRGRGRGFNPPGPPLSKGGVAVFPLPQRGNEGDSPHRPRPSPRPAHLAVGGAGFFLALLSKENAFLLPPVLLAWDAIRGGAGRREGTWWSRNGRWVAVWAAALALAVALRLGVAAVGFGTKDAASPFREVAVDPFLAARIVLKYLRLLALPWPLSSYYTIADLRRTLAPDLLGAAAALAVFALAFRDPRTRAGLSGLAWAGGFLAPVLGIVPLAGAIAAERHLYLPSVGFCLAAGGLAGSLTAGRRHGALLRGAGALLLGAALAGTALRSRIWADHFTLYEDMARTSPDAAIARFNHGKALAERGLLEQARDEYAAAARIAPRFADAHGGVGEVLLRQGRAAEAAAALAEAVRLEPDAADRRYSLGVAYLSLGRHAEAAAENRAALALQPRHALAANNLGVALSSLGRRDEAIEAFARSVAADPRCAGCFVNLGQEYAALGRRDEAAAAYAQALHVEPGNAAAAAALRALPAGRR